MPYFGEFVETLLQNTDLHVELPQERYIERHGTDKWHFQLYRHATKRKQNKHDQMCSLILWRKTVCMRYQTMKKLLQIVRRTDCK